MTPRRRRKNRAAQRLKALIAVLAVILAATVAVAIFMNDEPEEPTLQTDPPGSSGSTEPAESSTATEETQPSQPATEPLNGWVEENGSTCYYENGARCTGLHTVDGKTYAFGADGELLGGGWQTVDGNTYYLNGDGTVFTGWLSLEGALYYLLEDGTMAVGTHQIDGQTWFFTAAGRQVYMVNPWNYVPEGYTPELVGVSTDISKEGTKVDSSCYDALMAMMSDCAKAGYSVYITSSYRTQSYQQMLFDNQVEKQIANGYSREEAVQVAATISAVPGTSEHQLGLAVDIIDTQIWGLVEEQETLAGQQWLMAHCWEYGFILRYPKNKTEETGIIYEPWHYRYVGTQLAAELHGSGLTLEEYIAALS